MVITKIHSMMDTFTPTERKIADYILKNRNDCRSKTSYELAEELNIGQSNLIRFSQKLGYKGFRDLQVNIGIDTEDEYHEICESDSTEIINNKIVQKYINITRLTNSSNDANTVDKCVELIKKAKRIIVYGVGNSNLFAEYLSNHLIKMGIHSFSSTNAHVIYTATSTLDKNDLVILISETGETREIVKIAKISKNLNIPVIGITRYSNNSLSKYSTYLLYTCNDLSDSRLNAMTIRCSQLFIIDMLVLN
ncbi:MAG: MurR/RpiR family transcriptional regulator, partial [Traorella sp.]